MDSMIESDFGHDITNCIGHHHSSALAQPAADTHEDCAIKLLLKDAGKLIGRGGSTIMQIQVPLTDPFSSRTGTRIGDGNCRHRARIACFVLKFGGGYFRFSTDCTPDSDLACRHIWNMCTMTLRVVINAASSRVFSLVDHQQSTRHIAHKSKQNHNPHQKTLMNPLFRAATLQAVTGCRMRVSKADEFFPYCPRPRPNFPRSRALTQIPRSGS